MTEDQRQAANIAATLSGQMGAAALAMLTIVGALATFIIDKRDTTKAYVGLTVFSFGAFTLSIIAGGRAVAALYRAVNSGSWTPESSKSTFNFQAVALILGVVLMWSSLFATGARREEAVASQIAAVAKMASEQARSITDLDRRVAALQSRVDSGTRAHARAQKGKD